jgi:anthranilate phosphoribosyltransferase
VGDGRVAERLAGVLGAAGAERAWVVHGQDGLDELSTTAPSVVVEWRDGGIRSFVVDPASLGLKPARLEDIRGGDPAANALVVRDVLSGTRGHHRDIVLLNAAAALVVVGEAATLEDGLALSADSVDSGRAFGCLERLVSCSVSEAAHTS